MWNFDFNYNFRSMFMCSSKSHYSSHHNFLPDHLCPLLLACLSLWWDITVLPEQWLTLVTTFNLNILLLWLLPVLFTALFLLLHIYKRIGTQGSGEKRVTEKHFCSFLHNSLHQLTASTRHKGKVETPVLWAACLEINSNILIFDIF